MTPRNIIDPGGRKRRRAQLERLGGFWKWELEDLSIGGRTRVIAVLEQHDRTQCEIQKKLPHAYDMGFHIFIQTLLQREKAAVEELKNRSQKISKSWQLKLVKG